MKTKSAHSLLRIAVALALGLSACSGAFGRNIGRNRWSADKFSMFIHYGLYSHLGGVWDGKPVTSGYSEQILSFGVRFADRYEETALAFSPSAWNPDSIVALAKAAGMRSIVFTAKHHDGFCMYKTRTTPYNVADAAAIRRDLLKELSEACRKGGMKLGIYFSLIDWHFPSAMPVSSHNADSIPPMHHDYNLKQVRELLTNYGSISELWFDMGSLLPEQSRELYELVHRLQPTCRVSGRLGNGYGDFAVMPDNELPDGRLDLPWQTAASMYRETWGYRSWQKRVPDQQLAGEKLRDFVRVVCRGGNYLLNIGPRGDGAVVAQEQHVLKIIGRWLQTYGRAIYATRPCDAARGGDEGLEFSRTDSCLYIFIPTDAPVQELRLGPFDEVPIDLTDLTANRILPLRHEGKSVCIPVPAIAEIRPFSPWRVLRLSFAKRFNMLSSVKVLNTKLTPLNALCSYGYTQWDYYTGHRTIIAYRWHTRKVPRRITYGSSDSGRRLSYGLENESHRELRLCGGEAQHRKTDFRSLLFSRAYLRPSGGIFGTMPQLLFPTDTIDHRTWDSVPLTGTVCRRMTGIIGSMLLVQDVEARRATTLPIRLFYGNGLRVLLNGRPVTNRLIRNNAVNELTILLPLEKGKNRIVVKFFNRFGYYCTYGVGYPSDYTVYTLPLPLPGGTSPNGYRTPELRLFAPDRPVDPVEIPSVVLE